MSYVAASHLEITRGRMAIASGQAGDTDYLLYPSGHVARGGAGSAYCAFYLEDPRRRRVRLDAKLITNAVSPGVAAVLLGLNPVTAWGGASGARPAVTTIGSASPLLTITGPGASQQIYRQSDFVAAPTAGWYVLVAYWATAFAANALAELELALQAG